MFFGRENRITSIVFVGSWYRANDVLRVSLSRTTTG